MPEIGDIRIVLVPIEVDGWFNLNGQIITGNTVAEDSATLIFGSTTLPDYTDKYFRQSATVQDEVGSASITLTQAHLPKVKIPLSHDTATIDTYNTRLATGNTTAIPGSVYNDGWDFVSNSTLGADLNPNATQSAVDNRPATVGVRYMIFLGTDP